ncbi:uncharacterized protein EV422DRAFT_516327 [Fimicolochytrium jonesii]|uniref:uncharacterized protein n=1 Tax=Fimicolochytrium jonesii TaxID=1396493 RepID=UPI0022FF1144|nr:uncharacterized protein EV422DRAFT_516327 [Fimicolochytrium jonesii]KAI8824826.1 hypothetical protein EV422DRAFT_516327 [Fimicolochytrium jonesii]
MSASTFRIIRRGARRIEEFGVVRPTCQTKTVRDCQQHSLTPINCRSLTTRCRSSALPTTAPTRLTTSFRYSTASTPTPESDATEVQPLGTTKACFSEFQSFNEAVTQSRTTEDSLRRLIYKVSTAEDGELLRAALKRWRAAGRPQDGTDNLLVLERLFAVRAFDVVLQILCDRPSYRVFPDTVHVERLFRAFRAQVVEAAQSGKAEEKEIVEVLDKVYKAFAVALYTHIAPTKEMYTDLIMAGFESGVGEGRRRSEITSKEQVSLGLPLAPEVEAALATAQTA